MGHHPNNSNARARGSVSIELLAKAVAHVTQHMVQPFLTTVGMIDIHAWFGGHAVHRLMWQQEQIQVDVQQLVPMVAWTCNVMGNPHVW